MTCKTCDKREATIELRFETRSGARSYYFDVCDECFTPVIRVMAKVMPRSKFSGMMRK